jgi:glycosyltransferase involved in cell wall biosynthesis
MKLSVIIPVFNEEATLVELKEKLISSLSSLKYNWEIIFIDDGSQDESPSILEAFANQYPERITSVLFRRNFGQTAAIGAGIDYSSGEVIVLMDADLQNDPADIPVLLEKIEEGYDVVSGWRKNRQDNFLLRIMPSRIANKIISWVTGVNLHDYGCTLKAYRREVITGFRLYGEMHRFIPAYADLVGAKITEVEVEHHPRKHGKTKYGLERIFKVSLDLLTVKFLISYSLKPIYLFGGIGALFSISGFLMLLFLMIRRLSQGISPFLSPLFPTSIMLVILGFQAILMGLIAELLVRTYHEAQDKPTYSILKTIGGTKNNG